MSDRRPENREEAMSDYGTKEDPTTKAGLPTDRAKGHESACKDTKPSSDEPSLWVQTHEGFIRPATSDHLLAAVRRGVESGTIKGDRKWWCNILELAMPENPPDPSYRPGLPSYCERDRHGEQCGWRLVIPVGETS